MNPVGNTTGKSCDSDLRRPENRQNLLADLRPFSPGPPRAAVVAHQRLQSSERRFFAMHPALPGDHGAAYGQAPPRREELLRDLSREHVMQALDTNAAIPPTSLAHAYPPESESLNPAWPTGQRGAPLFGEALETPSSQVAMASGEESADLFDFVVNRLLSDDDAACDPEESTIRALMADYAASILGPGPDTLPPIGFAQEQPSEGESLNPAWPTGQRGAPLFGEALETPSSQAAMAFGEESADLFDFVVNRLLSDDDAAYDPEESTIRALMADFAASMLDTGPDTGAALPSGSAQEYRPLDESQEPGPSTGQTGAPPFDETLEAPSGQATMAFGDDSADLFDLMANRLLSDDYETYDPEDPDVRALMADYEATVLNMGLDTGAAPSTGQFDAIAFGERATWPTEPSADPDHARGKKRAGRDSMLLGEDQRQAILHIFETDPKRSSQSIADEFGVSYSTIQKLKIKFCKTGNIKAGDRANRLTADQRRAILHILETDPKRSTRRIVNEFGVAYTTALMLKRKFCKTGNIEVGDNAKRLTDDQRRAVLHIFKTDPKRSTRSIADEFDVNIKTIHLSRRQFSKTGTLKPKGIANRLTEDQRREILHIFRTDPGRTSQSIADEFNVGVGTIQTSRRQFGKTGNLKAGDSANRLTEDQRREILHIFRTDPQRSLQSIVDEFGVAYATIQVMKKRFGKTGNLKPKDRSTRLTGDLRRAILHIFRTDPQRNLRSIVDEFGVAYATMRVLKKRFRETGDIKPRGNTHRLTGDQRRAISHSFEANPERSSQSIADEYGVSLSTIKRLRKKFYKTGNVKPGDRANRLTDEQCQALLHIFRTDPERSSRSIADEFEVNLVTILSSRKKFRKTGDIKPGDYAHRLTDDQRRAILHIFETDPERNTQSIADEFDVNFSTIKRLREKFAKTGDIKPGDQTRRLTGDQRQALLHIFKTDPERSSQSIADEFSVNLPTIQKLKDKFAKTGDVKVGDRTHRLTGDQRQAISHIFETDSKKKHPEYCG